MMEPRFETTNEKRLHLGRARGKKLHLVDFYTVLEWKGDLS
jgi:hypothetical protein